MDAHQNPSQEQQSQRPMEATQSQSLPHPPPQACPRCNSNNTKFCYYNNYSLAQPRYFCKGCRRYWTHGGTLRNVPVGGGSRKRKRPNNNNKIPSSSANVSTTTTSIINRSPYFEQNSNGIGHTQNPPSNLLSTPITAGSFYGGGEGGGGFLSAVNFGPNLGLLHGLGLAILDHHGMPNNHQQEPMTFQQLLEHHHQNFHPGIGLSSAPSSSVDWILNSNNSDNRNNNDDNNNNNEQNQWSDFQQVGNTGLEDP